MIVRSGVFIKSLMNIRTIQGALIGFQCHLRALYFFIPKQMLYFKMNLMINLLETFQKFL